MSRRKAGRVPRRVDPDSDTDIEMPDLVMDVKPDLDLRSLAQGPWIARDMPISDVKRQLQTASRPLGAPSTCAPRMPLSSKSSGESLALAPASIGTFGASPLGMAPGPAWPPQPSPLISGFPPLQLGALTRSRAPPHHSPPASSLQTASHGPTSTQIC